MKKYWLIISNFRLFLKWQKRQKETKDDVFQPSGFDFNLEQGYKEKEQVIKEQYEIGFTKSEQNLAAISNTLKECDKRRLKDNRVIWNAANYIIILSYDLKVATYAVMKEQRQWNKLFFARQLCLILYECSEKIPHLLGKDFRLIIKKLRKGDEIMENINLVAKKIAKFHNDNKDFLHNIRNNATAHRDIEDTLNQLRAIETIEIEKVLRLSMQFDEMTNELGGAIMKAINAASTELR